MNEATKKYAYHLSYEDPTAHTDGISAEELKAADKCGTDAVLLASILYPPDGSLSILFRSFDGRNGRELEDNEWFKVFTLLAARLWQVHYALGEQAILRRICIRGLSPSPCGQAMWP